MRFRLTDVPAPVSPLRRRLDRLVLLARSALLWEVAWRGIAAVLVGVALFVSFAWFGLLLDRPFALRIAALLLCLAIASWGVWRAVLRGRTTHPRTDRGAALGRIDRDSGFAHREASTFDDTLANGADPTTSALWQLHQARSVRALASARVRAPRPQLARFDRYATRAAALLLLSAAAVTAGDERWSRLTSAFDWGGPPAPAKAGLRIDAWIDPPAYTGKPPIVLAKAPDAPITAPVGSAIVVRASDPAAVSVATEGNIAPKPIEDGAKVDAKTDAARRFVLRGDGKLIVDGAASGRAVYAITAIPDKPPTVELTSTPKANARASLTFNYRLTDDYGVIGAEAQFSSPEIDGKPVTGRTLVGPPRVGLALPVGQNGSGDASTTADLSEHPWAGARATVVLHAQDEGGNEGVSRPETVTLPQRRFSKPLARALVEQRRSLVLDPDHRERVASALAGLMIAPEIFGTTPAIYLGLRVGAQRLDAARTDAALLDVADHLWAMALQIEDGDLSESERDLRQAQKDLRDALARGAPDEEVRKLTQNLRAAMDKFLNEMAQRQAREDAERGDEPPQRGNRNARAVTRDDLKAMMDRMEEMAKSGNLADAQRMLEQMQNILENLRTAKRGKRNQQAQEMRQTLDELDALTRDQQALRDDTFRDKQGRDKKQSGNKGQKQQQQGKSGGQKAQPGDEDDDAAGNDDGDKAEQGADSGKQDRGKKDGGNLKGRQKALRDKLADLQRRVERMRRGKGGDKLGEADGAMKDAEEALGDEGDGDAPGSQPGGGKGGRGKEQGAAVDAQGRALEALRQGAQNLAGQMQQGQGQPGEGQGDDDGMADGDPDGDGDPQPGQPRQADGGSRDPLGRPTTRDPLYNPRAKYDPMGSSPALRAQRVLEELRRRLGDVSRPQGELDYLERLLRRY